MYRFTGFTQKANEALNNAITAAEDLGHTYVGSEHLLLGLLSENGGMAYTGSLGEESHLRRGRVNNQKQRGHRLAYGAFAQ